MVNEPWEWDERYLQQLIDDQVEESSRLEYKAAEALAKSDGKKTELSKDVSAFANSAGGTIVYGIRESSGTAPRYPEALDGVDPSQYSKEWLDQVINSRIRERILGVSINPVSLTGTQIGKVAYVVYIPQSSTAHQASDHRYYRRFNFESVAMEHHEIMDVLNRVTHPEVIAEVKGTSRQPDIGYDADNRSIVALSIKLKNTGHRVANRVAIQFWIPEGYNVRGNLDPISQSKGGPILRDGISYRSFIYYHRQRDGIFPLFPGTEAEVLDGTYCYMALYLFRPKEVDSQVERILWEVYADDAPVERGSVPLYELFF